MNILMSTGVIIFFFTREETFGGISHTHLLEDKKKEHKRVYTFYNNCGLHLIN